MSRRAGLSFRAVGLSALLSLGAVLSSAQEAATVEPLQGLPGVEVMSRDARGVPAFVAGELGVLRGSDRGPAAVRFLRDFTVRTMGGVGSEEFVVRNVLSGPGKEVHVRVQQHLRGLPVLGAELIVHADAKTGKVMALNGRFVPDRDLPSEPALSPSEIVAAATQELQAIEMEVLKDPELVYLVDSEDRALLAWRFRTRYVGPEGETFEDLAADAMTGRLVSRVPRFAHAKNRETYTAHGTNTPLPGTLLITEGGSSSDAVAQTAHNHMGKFHDYMWSRFWWDSWDGYGATMISTVRYVWFDPGTNHYNPNNASWDIYRTPNQAIFGQGDGVSYHPFSDGQDIVAHEFSHGFVRRASGLELDRYYPERSALIEHLCDVFGAGTEAYADGGASSETWKIGEDIVIGKPALRYMDHPRRGLLDWQLGPVDFYPEFNNGTNNHDRAGIGNLAFSLLVNGGSHPRGRTPYVVTGIGIAKAERIFFDAVTRYLMSASRIADLRDATVFAARGLFGAGSLEESSVRNSWCAVGVGCYEGVHEVATCSTISGWAWEKHVPDYAAEVEIYADYNTWVADIRANQPRPDLPIQGNHGFSHATPGWLKDGIQHNIFVRFNRFEWLQGSSKPILCGAKTFTTQTPESFLDAAPGYVVATQFSSNVNGKITGLRFYRAPGELYDNQLRLWTENRNQLASVTVQDNGSSGWRTEYLPNPVSITAGTLYRVSVNTNIKQSKTPCGLMTPITNGPLTAHQGFWGRVADGNFPETSSCSNFFVDVIFDRD